MAAKVKTITTAISQPQPQVPIPCSVAQLLPSHLKLRRFTASKQLIQKVSYKTLSSLTNMRHFYPLMLGIRLI